MRTEIPDDGTNLKLIHPQHFLWIVCCLGMIGCSELKNDTNLPSPVSPQVRVHEQGWGDTASANFHGKVLKKAGYSSNNCVSCHAKSFAGGTSGVTCFQCHTTYPHTTDWSDSSAVLFHGRYLHSKNWQLSDCTPCHGNTFTGGTSGVACSDCHATYPHKAGWVDSSGVSFHGKFLQSANWRLSDCSPCHGSSFTGGRVDRSCFDCHSQYPHPAGWATPGEEHFHGNFIKTAGWDMRPCQTCHGATYAGGRTSVSCLTCHSLTAGPENCTTCHGSPTSIAPPPDLNHNTNASARGVGAHQTHLEGSEIRDSISCTECHSVPGSVYAPGHFNASNRAQVVFNNPLANTVTNEPGTTFWKIEQPVYTPSPSYNQSTLKCSNVYCHGYFKNGNQTFSPSFAPTWNDTTGASDACGTCHGDVNAPLDTLGLRYVPRTTAHGGTHPDPVGIQRRCNFCHGDVVDANFNIINPSKHINGKLNVFGLEVDW